MKEIIELRKEREKHFLNDDGTITACIYNEDIHYLENGEYKEIDNTLVENGNSYTNKENDFKVEFDSNNLYKISNKKYSLTCNILNINNYNMVKENNLIKFENVLRNIDITYGIIGKEIKENIIIKDINNDLNKLVFKLNTSVDLKIDNNKIIGENENKEIFRISSPYIILKSRQVNNNIKYSLTKVENYYLLSLDIDTEILNDSNNYPLIIDPTISDSDNLNVYDTFIHPNDTNVERNNLDHLKIGVDSNGVIYRSLIKFELPPLATGNDVISATAVLTSHPRDYRAADYIHENIGIHQMLEDWSEENANWNTLQNKYNTKLENATIINRTYQEMQNEELQLVLSYNYLDITSLVKKWYSGTPNYGILLKFINETYNSDCKEYYMYSKNNTETPSRKPVLYITYRNHNGLVNYMSYNSLEGKGFMTYINNYTGNITNIFDVAKLTGSDDSFIVKLIHNTNDINEDHLVPAVYGWRFNFEQRLIFETIEGVEYVKYINDTGRIIHFKMTDNYTYVDEDGLGYRLEYEDTRYFIIDKDATIYYFVTKYGHWYLDSIEYANGNTITLTSYGGQIYEIETQNKKKISITYSNDYITIISDIGETKINVTDNEISSIEYENVNISIKYNSNNCIEKIIGYDGMGYSFEYFDKTYRVSKITELGLNNQKGFSTLFEYGFNTTSLIDSDGKKITYIFDNLGRTVGTVGCSKNNSLLSEAYGFNTSYVDSVMESSKVNKVSNVTGIINYVNNLLNDSSFETNNMNFEISNASVVNNNSRTGENALKLNNGKIATLSYSIKDENDYTISFYLKSDLTSNITVSLYNVIGEEENLIDSIIISNNNKYERYSLSGTFTNNSKLVLKFANVISSNTYIDDIQLEVGMVANLYNLISNSDFSQGILGWNTQGGNMNTGDDISNFYTIEKINDKEFAFKFISNPDHSMSLSRLFHLSGKAGDVYHLSFWYKNEGNVVGGEEQGNIANICFYPKDEELGMCPDIYSLTKNDSEWQFFNMIFVAEYDYSDFSLSIISQGEINSLYITNINLVKDYEDYIPEYDDNGNLISVSKTLDVNKNIKRDRVKYSEYNDYIKTDLADGTISFCEYDENNNVISETHSSGITKRYYYDSFGNQYKTKLLNIYNNGQPISNGKYYIRRKNSMKYLNINYQNKKCILKEEDCNKLVFDIQLNNSNITMQLATNTNLKISTVGDAIYLNENIISTYVLEKSENEGYYIKNGEKYFFVENDELKLSSSEKTEFIFESVDNPLYLEEKILFDSSGNYIEESIDYLGNKTSFEINSSTGLKDSITFPNSKKTSYIYDEKRRISNLTCNDKKISYEYNSNNMLSKINSGNNEYSFVYDDYLNYKSFIINDKTLINNEYANGLVKKNSYSNGSVISHLYDEHNRLKEVDKDNRNEKYYYDNRGLLAKIIYGNNNYTNIYDYDSNISKKLIKLGSNSFEINYQRDNKSKLESKILKLNEICKNVKYIRDDNYVINKVESNELSLIYNFDYLGRLIYKNINDIIEINYDFYRNGNKTSILVNKYTINGKNYYYLYDNNYDLLHIKDDNGYLYSYVYDKYEELIEETNYLENIKTKYSYDLYGNMLENKVYSLEDNELLNTNTFEYKNSWKDQLSKYNNISISYDSIGNPISIGENTLEWQNGRELKKYQNNLKNLIIDYEYDYSGIRTKKIVNNIETEYFLEGNKIIFEKTGDNTIYYMYDENMNVMGFEYLNNKYYFKKNLYNDVIGILNASGDLIANYSYDAWGNILSITDSNNNIITDSYSVALINPFRYRSFYYDKENDLYYLNKRYYSPKLCRFINADGTIGENQDIYSYNLYLYSSNNPIKNYDSEGESIFGAIAICGIIGAALNVAPTFIGDVVTSVKKKKISFSAPKKYVSKAVGGAVGGATSLLPFGGVISIASSSIAESVTTSLFDKKNVKETAEYACNNLVEDLTTGLVSSLIKIPGLNAGRNSYNAVFKSGITKISKNTAAKISFKVIAKGVAVESFGTFTTEILKKGYEVLTKELPKNPQQAVNNEDNNHNRIECCNLTQNYPTLAHSNTQDNYYCLCARWD